MVTRTDLGIAHVDSDGHRDVVYLAHNELRAFAVTCLPGKESRIQISKEFYTYGERQWEEVFAVYLNWKRKNHDNFKLPNHSGRKKDGSTHPWRTVGKRERPRL